MEMRGGGALRDVFEVFQPVAETEPRLGPTLFRQSLLIPEHDQALDT